MREVDVTLLINGWSPTGTGRLALMDTKTTLPDLIARNDAKTLLHCHAATLRRWEKAGRLTPIKLSATRVLYRREDITKLIADATVSTIPSK